MMDQIEWSLDMIDTDFVDVSEKYFKRSRIDLHIGCCLVAKVDPETKEPPVGTDYQNWDDHPEPDPYDYTRRPFEVAREALWGQLPENPLVASEALPTIISNSKDIKLSTRMFVKWVTKNWPKTTKYFKLAEANYQKNKKNSPKGYLSSPKYSKKHIWLQIGNELQKLKNEGGKDFAKLSTREKSNALAKRLVGTPLAREIETIRKRKSLWVE